MQQTVTYIWLYIPSSVSYWQCRCHRQQARDLSVQWDAWNPTYGRLLAMNGCPTYQKDLSLVVDDTGIVSKILMMLYIARYKPRLLHVERWVVSLSYHLQESTWFSNAQPHPQNTLSLVNLFVSYGVGI
jgi:hypothetical protein